MIKYSKPTRKDALLALIAACLGVSILYLTADDPRRSGVGMVVSLLAVMFIWIKLFVWESRDD